ncbi:putative signal recognition particle subunit [Clavispora lusitaniae]|uniref:Signal recognition particle subunit n=2 Tax=Clavispora lusitaniae TaxID=36911 RepID=A0ACD0WMS6_CLALS|nr:hypothetical protein E0198_003483 [Clavispora lusitaniae]KAF7582286.1 Signal recognition particle 14kD family protein [Clavispora lusitaniae]OVF10836.1 putative RNA-binding signal recognition particle subunit [Clavispora lusitaniae]QFZ28633.1 putative signal recognition particle subunit [Clavispora lusitaniae]QFZ34296.1 putative signal recognition particle subunit [Clavispora lusitaniae]
MGRLNNTDFLSKISNVLEVNDGKSSVYLTQKRLVQSLEPSSPSTLDDLSSNVVEHPREFPSNHQRYPILIRFTNGDKKNKWSTVVEHENLDTFWTEYTQILKSGFVGLRKKEKKKAKKGKVSKA